MKNSKKNNSTSKSKKNSAISNKMPVKNNLISNT